MLQVKPEAKKKKAMPHSYVILALVIIFVAVLTYIIPAGQYDKVVNAAGRSVADPNSFHFVERNATTLFGLFQAIPKGLVNAADIVFFIFLIGGAFEVILSTKALEAAIGRFAISIRKFDILVIPMLMFIFSLGGATFGMAEEVLVFIPLAVTLARALGYDALVGLSMCSIGAAIGFNSGFMNPFTVGVAQGIAELPMFSGMELRIVVWLVYLAVSSAFVMLYAKKIKKDPAKSIVIETELQAKDNMLDLNNIPKMTKTQIAVLLAFAGGMGILVFGVFKYGWYITELTAMFLGMGIVCGLIARMSPSDIAKSFVQGARGIAFGALVVGVSRAVLVVMREGMIIDTVIYGLSNGLKNLHSGVSAVAMYAVQIVINTFIPSGSGQASATMPIMAPLADVLGITRQTAVMAFQFGDGFTNSIIPTGGIFAALSIAGVTYDKWLKYVMPLMYIWIGLGAVFVLIANAISFGPF